MTFTPDALPVGTFPVFNSGTRREHHDIRTGYANLTCQISRDRSYIGIDMRSSRLKRSKQILSLLAAERGVIGVYSPLMIGLSVAGVAAPFATGRFIDALACRQSPAAPFAILAALLILKAALTPMLQRFICARSRAIETDLQFRILATTMDLEPSRLASAENGEIVAKMSRDTYAVGGFVREFFPRMLQAVVMMFTAGCALYTRSPVLAISFMAIFPLTILLFSPFTKKFSENSHRIRVYGDTSFGALFDFLISLPMLRMMDAERRFADIPSNAFRKLKEGNDESDALSVRFGFLLGLLLVIGEVAVLGIAGTMAAKGRIPIGDVVLYQMLFITAIQSIQGVISLMPELAAVREGVDSLSETLDRTCPENGHIRIEKLENLRLRHVTFAYPGASGHPVIKDFSADFHTGSIIGLSGANGVGKSTLLKLAMNALEPQHGEILVNGHPFRDIDLADFRRRIGVVSQDNLIITGTIRDNITLRDPNFNQSDIDRALSLSGFDTVVKRLPDGLDTIVGSQVRSLSGGERQRLAVARAVIRDPIVLILDEATNHLDAESRGKIVKLANSLRSGRLILIAGHDPELDKICDRKISCQIQENTPYIKM